MMTLTWDQTADATGSSDEVESSVRRAYRDAGLTEPERVIVVGSPAAGAIAALWLTGTDEVRASVEGLEFADLGALKGVQPGRSVRNEVRTVPWERARAEVSAALGPEGWAALWGETGGLLWPRVNRLVTEIRGAIAALGGEPLRQATLDAVLGQHDSPWLSAFDDPSSVRSLDGLPGADQVGGLEDLGGLRAVARNAGWWWPFERVAIVSSRPAELHLDDSGRLHRAEGPAMRFPDGFALNAWHGMPVPPGFGLTMADLSPERIRAEENAELRRVMLEHFGLERYLAESGAQPLHSDETGVLWQIDLPGDEPVAMVEVINSTPEPDGTRRTYFLRVPPWVRKAREGVAWTFGLNESDYHPEKET